MREIGYCQIGVYIPLWEFTELLNICLLLIWCLCTKGVPMIVAVHKGGWGVIHNSNR